MVYEFKLPDIGEGVAEAEIIKWMVKEGEKVKEDQPLVEVMTDKVNVQIPAPRTGTVSRIAVREGEVAKVGQMIVAISEDGETAAPPAPSSSSQTPALSAAPAQSAPGHHSLPRGSLLHQRRGSWPESWVSRLRR